MPNAVLRTEYGLPLSNLIIVLGCLEVWDCIRCLGLSQDSVDINKKRAPLEAHAWCSAARHTARLMARPSDYPTLQPSNPLATRPTAYVHEPLYPARKIG